MSGEKNLRTEFVEMSPERIRQEVDEKYPDLAGFIGRAIESLYAAVWFGTITEPLIGFTSATDHYIHSESWRPEADTDVARLNVASGLFEFASHDSWYEALISGAGYELADLPLAPRCPKCAGIVDIDCLCEEIQAEYRRLQEADDE